MRIHATIVDRPQCSEVVEGESMFIPGLAVSVSEIVRRQALGLPLGVGVHGVTDIPEGMSYEEARFEALRYIRMEEIRKEEAAAAAQAVPEPSAAASPTD